MSPAQATSSIQNFSHAVTLQLELCSQEVQPGLFAFRLTRSLEGDVPAQFKQLLLQSRAEGLATKVALDAFKSGKAEAIAVTKGAWASPLFLHTAQRKSFTSAWEENPDKNGYTQELRQDVYAAIVEEGLSADNLVVCDYSSHMLFSWNGENLPVGIRFEYISGQMHNVNYDLPSLVRHLEKDTRVTFNPGKNGEVIQDIPYYNADGKRSRFVDFTFSPTAENAIAMWQKMQSYKTNHPSTRVREAIMDLDLLHLKGTGIPCDTEESGD